MQRARALALIEDFKNKELKQLHDQIINLVTQLLSAKKQLPAIQSSAYKEYLDRKCHTLDSYIDQLIYELRHQQKRNKDDRISNVQGYKIFELIDLTTRAEA